MRRFTLVMFALFAVATAAVADEVHLADGSKLVGTVVQIAGGKLTLKTDFAADPLVIDMTKVKGVTTAAPLNVQVASGDRAIGKLEYDAAGGKQAVTGDLVGKKDLAVDQLASAWAAGAEDPAIVAMKAQEAKWSLSLQFGLNGETGNNERIALNGGFALKRTAPHDRTTIYGTARYGKENGSTSAQEYIGGVAFEADINDRLFWYLKGELENDRFENVAFRSTTTGGIGYFFIKEKITELKGRVGLGYQYEDFYDDTDTSQAVAEAGIDFRHEFTPWLAFEHHTTVYPSLQDIGDTRIVMENVGVIPISSDKKWKLKLGMKNQYDTQPNERFDELDTFYFLNVAVDF